MLSTNRNESRFYFLETSIDQSITADRKKYNEHCGKYLINIYEKGIFQNEIIEKAGGIIVENENYDINLSPENLERDSIETFNLNKITYGKGSS